MGRAGRRVALAATVALLLGACDDDADAARAQGIPQEQYEAKLAELCRQHGSSLEEAGGVFAERADSDAERVAYYRTDWIPRVRTIIRALDAEGFPEGRVQEYREVLSEVLEHLQDFERNTYGFIDAYAEGRLEPEDNYIALVLDGLDRVGIGCVRDAEVIPSTTSTTATTAPPPAAEPTPTT